MYSIGLDIGIASVGWSVIDTETGYIDDLGVRLFSARNSDNNKVRRENRSGRRLRRRRVTRLNDAKKFLEMNGFYLDKQLQHVSPYEIRVRGLSEKLSKGEIYQAVLHIIKKRGISYLDDDAEIAKEGAEYSQQVQLNLNQLKERTPGQIQLERLEQEGRIRTGVNPKGQYRLNVFTVQSYARELEKILICQQDFYPEITNEFIRFFISNEAGEKGLVYRKRPYYHGPGNEHNPSPYGRWANYPQTGQAAENIFDKLVGKDLTGEIRASGLSVSAQKYNLLNDLNNLTLPGDQPKLTTEQKEQILHHLMYDHVNSFGPKALLKELGLHIEVKDVHGWRVDKNDKPEIHTMAAYRRWVEIFRKYDVEIYEIDEAVLDKIAFIVTLNTEKEAIIHTLERELEDLNEAVKQVVVNEYTEMKKGGSGQSWHSFSPKILRQLIGELLYTSEEQNTILERLGLKFDLRNKYSHLSQIPLEEMIQEIYNPTVSKSVRQSILVLNALVKRYGKENISHVTIEMPRDKNSDDQKKSIQKIQKNNEERKKQSKQYFLEKSGWTEAQFEYELRKPGFAKKLSYYYEQDGRCPYTGKAIQPEDLVTGATEIDHIIPLSISMDDSMHNKVLVMAKANQVKAQRSPYQAFMEGADLGRNWEEYVAWVTGNKQYNKKKRMNLLNTEDIYSPEVQKRFVARNLNDTRYASRVVLNAVQSFFYATSTKVCVINGAFTHTLRKKWPEHLEKTRETHHHHAVDATLCAVSPSEFLIIDRFRYFFNEETKTAYMVNTETGESVLYSDYKKMNLYEKKSYYPKWNHFIEQLEPTKLYPKIHFSHQVDKKWNRKVSDATLYSTREKLTVQENKKKKEIKETYMLGYIKDIYTPDGYKEFVKHKENLLMKELDVKSYDILCHIADTYPSQIEKQDQSGKVKTVDVSPFKLYCEDNGIPAIQKFSHKGNGPVIRKLKYYDKKIGSHINITKDKDGEAISASSRGKQVVLCSLNPWRTDVYYDREQEKYLLLGIKYNHLRYIEGEYGIPASVYQELKKAERIPESAEFKFSLYRKTRIEITQGEEVIEGLYHSRTTNSPNYFEMKPVNKASWDKAEVLPIFGKASSGRIIKGIGVGMILKKMHIDILGQKYYVDQEELKGIL